MARAICEFDIDDTLSVAANLSVFIQRLEQIDPALCAAIAPYISRLIADEAVDNASIWGALLVATTEADERQSD
jgi:hypothetical protein